VAIDEAHEGRQRIDLERVPASPAHPGVHDYRQLSIADLRPFIDWTPFLQTWELAGRWPEIADDPIVGAQARELVDDANRMLDRIEAEGWLEARARVGLFPAASTGPAEITVYTDETRTTPRARLHCLRQQFARTNDRAFQSLADFVAPVESGVADWIGGFVVTAGIGAEALARGFEAEHDDYQAILARAVADRLAEALAESMHRRVRTDMWGYAADETLDNDSLIAEAYQGIRPAPGYPACPDHTEKGTLFELLDATELGVELTESFAIHPAASVAGWYFGHPEARYFGVGRIGRDQVEAYAAAKGMSVAEAERWLAPSLGYRPEDS
jgi:5-methyltetrahydrofolate--homocysteine methyltransferase